MTASTAIMRPLTILATGVALLLAGASAWSAAFTPGNLVIYRAGDGTGTLINTGNVVFLDEYTPLGVLVQSIPLPTSPSGANYPLIASGTATSEGMLNLSPDGRFLTLTGYDTTLGGTTSLSSTTSAAVPRVLGVVDATGLVNTSTALTDFASANNPRSAATVDGVTLYAAGGSSGLREATLGSTTSTQLSTSYTNLRDVNVYGGQLYVSSGASTLRLGTVGTGVPATTGPTIANLPGLPTTGSSSFNQFYFADLSPTVAGLDTFYVADDASTGGIEKYSLLSGTWTLEGTITNVAGDAFRGLTGSTSADGVVTLFATSNGSGGATGGGRLVTVVDASGQTGSIAGLTPTVLASAAANQNFRGVSFVPTPEPASFATFVAGAALLGLARRRKSKVGYLLRSVTRDRFRW